MSETKKTSHSSANSVMATYLPPDLVTDICLRLPMAAILRFRAVSKGWHSLLTDKNFMKMWYESKKENPNFLFVSSVFTPHRMYTIDKLSISSRASSALLKRIAFPFEYQRPTLVSLVSSSMGVILLRVGTAGNLACCLWTPATKVCRIIPDPPACFKEVVYSLCHDDRAEDMKLVRVVYTSESTTEIHVYSLRFNRWDIIVCFGSYELGYCLRPSVFLNQSIHWLDDFDRLIYYSLHQNLLGTFDMPHHLCLKADKESGLLQLGKVTESLSLLCQDMDEGKLEFWVMNNYGDANSWSKVFETGLGELNRIFYPEAPLSMLSNGHLLFLNELGLIVYNPETDQATKLKLLTEEGVEEEELLEAVSYVGSLISLK